MCGRYYIADEETIIEMREIIREVNQRYAGRAELEAMKTGEIFPTNVVPVLVAGHPAEGVQLMTWGFPRWQGSGVIINARAETAAEKPLFRASLAQKRCIVPSNGFYEWDHPAGKAQNKYLLQQKDAPMLYMAGLYSAFTDRYGAAISAFVIITTAANATVSQIHNRMPLILDRSQLDLWLGDAAYASSILTLPCAIETQARRVDH